MKKHIFGNKVIADAAGMVRPFFSRLICIASMIHIQAF